MELGEVGGGMITCLYRGTGASKNLSLTMVVLQSIRMEHKPGACSL